MPWDAQGKWIPEKQPAPTVGIADPRTTQPIATGLLAGAANPKVNTSGVNPQMMSTGSHAPQQAQAPTGPVAPDQTNPLPLPNPDVPAVTPPVDNSAPGPDVYNDSVEMRLNGLLDTNSAYIQRARQDGLNTANKRGLVNSSMAAGAAEGAAIDRGLPIAAQDAAQAASKNLQNMQTATQLTIQERENAAVQARQLLQQGHELTVQDRDLAAQWLRQLSSQDTQLTLQERETAAAMVRQLSAQDNQLTLQERESVAAMERLLASQSSAMELQQGQIDSAERQALLAANVSVTNNQSGNQASLIANYMQSFAAIAQNKDIPAATRDAYIRLFDNLAASGMNLISSFASVPLSWGGTPGATPAPATGTPAPPSPPPPGNDAPAVNAGPQPDANGLYNPLDLHYQNGNFYLPDGTQVAPEFLKTAPSL